MKNGIINIYKEAGYTSFDVCAKLRGILHEKKLGHTGTLDPMAEGVLPVCIGKATKLVGLLTDKPKEYVTEFELGKTSDTQDITGNVVTKEFNGELTEEKIFSVIQSFIGEIDQLTPMYSARKVDGKKLYEYAREGREVERKTVRIHIYSISDIEIDMEKKLVSMRVLCEKGTYIRTLCNDIGEKLGCGAVMTKLLRTKVDVFELMGAYRLSELEKLRVDGKLETAIIGPDSLFEDCRAVKISEELKKYVINGNPLREDNFECSFTENEIVRIYDNNGTFLALYRFSKGMLRTEILFIE
ncbi:MAG: tRNA pseudouridine(55) synthase TruB [Lachnospiraceae bacterium]|nr:tRNA pseudouridine(55) synthase TruB [Lachnospiraceae bacterium]